MGIKSGLEKIIKSKAGRYLGLGTAVIFETPLHEGTHALTAKISPWASCSKVVISDRNWYSEILEVASLGFFDSAPTRAGTAGYAMIGYEQNTLGHLSHALASSTPEVLTMTLATYLIINAAKNISKKGEQVYSIAQYITGAALTGSTFYYTKLSALNPSGGSDHLGFTTAIMNAMHVPTPVVETIGPYLTWGGAGLMMGASLYLADILTKNKE